MNCWCYILIGKSLWIKASANRNVNIKYECMSVYHLSTKASGGVIIHVLCPWWASLFDVTDETEESKHHKSFERFSEVVKVLGCFINASPTPLKYNLEILGFKRFAEQTGKCAHSHADVRDQHTVCARSLSVPLGKLTGHQSMQLWWYLPFLQSPSPVSSKQEPFICFSEVMVFWSLISALRIMHFLHFSKGNYSVVFLQWRL